MSKETDIAALEARLRERILFVADATTDARADRLPDLGTLDADIGKLCEAVENLPPEDAAALGPLMAEMIGGLEILATELRDFQDRHTSNKESPDDGHH